jgi:hypothetical protein
MSSIFERVDSIVYTINQESGPTKCPKYAYCCLLYGASPSNQLIANSLAMIHSLKVHSDFPLIFLHTSDVPADVLEVLNATGLVSEFRLVEYIYGHASLYRVDWFHEVFTKLQIFNLTDFDRVVFLDLDFILNSSNFNELFKLPINIKFAAFENSKSSGSPPSAWLEHGQRMGRWCGLINAGVILVTPDSELFETLVSDATGPSPDHRPGTTPEQYYLARVLGRHFHHIDQIFNLEVQIHGGVPVTPRWLETPDEGVWGYHFSGGRQLAQIEDQSSGEWGSQNWKKSSREKFAQVPNPNLIHSRSRAAHAKWARHFASAAKIAREGIDEPEKISDSVYSILYLGMDEAVDGAREIKGPFIGDSVDEDSIIKINKYKIILNPQNEFKYLKLRPNRPPPNLFD